MKKVAIIYVASLLAVNAFGSNGSKSNFSKDKNVAPSEVLSYLAEDQVVFYRNDSAFVATVNEDGELQNIAYDKEISKLKADGQISVDPTNKMAYYTQSGKMMVSSQKEKGKWGEAKPIIIKGAGVERDKYRGSVLAYANWRYMPKDSVVVVNPAINKDGTRLYFASNMQGSKGLDIWYMDKDENNEWGEPVRMDSRVNSDSDEDFPLVRDNGAITFASNRQTGESKPENGKYDLYYFNPESGKEPVLLAKLLSDDLKESELVAENVISEPSEKEGEDRSQGDLLADNNDGSKDKPSVNNNKQNGKSGDSKYDDRNSKDGRTAGGGNNYKNNSDGNQSNKDNLVAERLSQNDENAKVLKALDDNKRIKSSNDRVSSEELKSTFNSNPEAVVKASSNVVATVDKRIFYFDYDKDVLNGSYKNDIEVILDFLKAYPNNDFLIIGHTDERGSNEYNDALSLKRAKKIESILVSRGISKSRLHVIAMGEYQPVITNARNESEHQKNRRVEIQRME